MADNSVALGQRVKIDGRIVRESLLKDFEVEIGTRSAAGDSRCVGIRKGLGKQTALAREEVGVLRLSSCRPGRRSRSGGGGCWQLELEIRAAGNADLFADEPIRFRGQLHRRDVR